MNYAFYYDAARNALDWHARQLKEPYHDWLRTLTYRKDLEDLDLSFCHGSPVGTKTTSSRPKRCATSLAATR